MIKFYCDLCGRHLRRNYVYERLIRKLDDIIIEVHVSIKKVWNNGEICLKCLLNVINNGEDGDN